MALFRVNLLRKRPTTEATSSVEEARPEVVKLLPSSVNLSHMHLCLYICMYISCTNKWLQEKIFFHDLQIQNSHCKSCTTQNLEFSVPSQSKTIKKISLFKMEAKIAVSTLGNCLLKQSCIYQLIPSIRDAWNTPMAAVLAPCWNLYPCSCVLAKDWWMSILSKVGQPCHI